MLFLHLVRLVLYRKRLNLDMEDRDDKPPQNTSQGSGTRHRKKDQQKKTNLSVEILAHMFCSDSTK